MQVNRMAVDYLRNALHEDPQNKQLNLEYMQISDLLPIMSYLLEFTSLTRLSLHENKLRQLPADLSRLKTLTELDLSNNDGLVEHLDLLLPSLATLPSLRRLTFKHPNRDAIIRGLHNLEFLNNERIVRQVGVVRKSNKMSSSSSMSSFRQRMRECYSKLLEIQQKYFGQYQDQSALDKFTMEMDKTIERAQAKTEKDLKSEALISTVQLIAQFDTYELLKVRALNICMDIYNDLGTFIKTVVDEQDTLFKSLSTLTFELIQIESDYIEEDYARKNTIDAKEQQLQYSLIGKVDRLQKEVKRTRLLKDQIDKELLEAEASNRKLLQALVKHGKVDYSGSIQIDQMIRKRPVKAAPQQERDPEITRISKGPINNINNFGTKGLSQPNKSLTLNQLKEIIEEIYNYKVRFDNKNLHNGKARETMLQYLSTHFIQKYGLKNLATDALSGIIQGIRMHADQDCDVALFGKMLKNKVDEEFRGIHEELKRRIRDLMFRYSQKKQPLKSRAEIMDGVDEIIRGGEIAYEEGEDIVRFLFTTEDSDEILRRMQLLPIQLGEALSGIHHHHNISGDDSSSFRQRRRLNTQTTDHHTSHRRRLRFAAFQKLVLSYHLQIHEKILQKLVMTFKSQDTDADGILNEDQFFNLVAKLCPDERDDGWVEELLERVDPNQVGRIPFTEVARLLLSYPEDNPILLRIQSQR